MHPFLRTFFCQSRVTRNMEESRCTEWLRRADGHDQDLYLLLHHPHDGDDSYRHNVDKDAHV